MSIKNCHWQYLELGRALRERETYCAHIGAKNPN